jgi:hypothetical protein
MKKIERVRREEPGKAKRQRRYSKFVYCSDSPDVLLARATSAVKTRVREIEHLIGTRDAYCLLQQICDDLVTKDFKREPGVVIRYEDETEPRPQSAGRRR